MMATSALATPTPALAPSLHAAGAAPTALPAANTSTGSSAGGSSSSSGNGRGATRRRNPQDASASASASASSSASAASSGARRNPKAQSSSNKQPQQPQQPLIGLALSMRDTSVADASMSSSTAARPTTNGSNRQPNNKQQNHKDKLSPAAAAAAPPPGSLPLMSAAPATQRQALLPTPVASASTGAPKQPEGTFVDGVFVAPTTASKNARRPKSWSDAPQQQMQQPYPHPQVQYAATPAMAVPARQGVRSHSPSSSSPPGEGRYANVNFGAAPAPSSLPLPSFGESANRATSVPPSMLLSSTPPSAHLPHPSLPVSVPQYAPHYVYAPAPHPYFHHPQQQGYQQPMSMSLPSTLSFHPPTAYSAPPLGAVPLQSDPRAQIATDLKQMLKIGIVAPAPQAVAVSTF